MEYIYINNQYRPLENAVSIEPIIETPSRLKVRVVYPDIQAVLGDAQVPGILESVYRRRVGSSSNSAMEAIMQAVSDTMNSLNVHVPEPETKSEPVQIPVRKRAPRVLKNKPVTTEIYRLMALARWANKRGESDKAAEYRQQADALKAQRSIAA